MSQPQHLAALARANAVRLERAEIKRDVFAGERNAADLILNPPASIESMTVFDLLRSQHRWGRYRALKVIHSVPLPEAKTLGALTLRQREALAFRLSGRYADDGFDVPLRDAA